MYFETSAATGHNVTKSVECLLDAVMLRMEQAVDKKSLPLRNGQKKGLGEKQEEPQDEGKCGC